jgi:O-acetylserine/cysteine efflux transporter
MNRTVGAGPGMPIAHLLLALLVVAIWGTNFVVMDVGLSYFPPLTFAGLRFALASLPLLLFVPRPRIALAQLASYGLLSGVGQFGLMLYALSGHISPGLASLLIQAQAFFTVGLASLLARESVRAGNLAALALCAVGVLLIAANMGGDADLTGILLVLGAALSWAGANIVVKRAGAINMFALVVWSGPIAAGPLLALALLLEGYPAMAGSVANADGVAWATLLWQCLGNALFGYAAWNWLLSRHPAAEVAPMGLLVPIFGLSASAWFVGEPMPPWKLAAAALVLAGLGINLAASRRAANLASPPSRA